MLTTHGDEVRKYQSREELLRFLGPIDSPEDALLLLYYDNHPVLCQSATSAPSSFNGIDPASVRELADGFEVLQVSNESGCAGTRSERVTLHVTTDATVTETAREVTSDMTVGRAGRRPEGLRSRHVRTSPSALGELAAHGAPAAALRPCSALEQSLWAA